MGQREGQKCPAADLEDSEEAMSQGTQGAQALRAEKADDCLLWSLGGSTACQHLSFGPMNCIPDYWIQNLKRTNVYYTQSRLWWFISDTIENEHNQIKTLDCYVLRLWRVIKIQVEMDGEKPNMRDV